MMTASQRTVTVLAAIVAGALLLGLIGPCGRRERSPDVNDELARMAREAMEAAREAQAANDAAYMLPGRYRLLAVAIGVSVPVAAAVVVLYLSLRHPPADLEVAAEVERQQQIAGVAPPALIEHEPGQFPLAARSPTACDPATIPSSTPLENQDQHQEEVGSQPQDRPP